MEQNWKYERLEVDIIAKKNNTLVFVEVKARASSHFGHPEEFVDDAKQERIIEAAESYVLEHPHEGETRFDIIAINLSEGKRGLRHIKDAFYPSF